MEETGFLELVKQCVTLLSPQKRITLSGELVHGEDILP